MFLVTIRTFNCKFCGRAALSYELEDLILTISARYNIRVQIGISVLVDEIGLGFVDLADNICFVGVILEHQRTGIELVIDRLLQGVLRIVFFLGISRIFGCLVVSTLVRGRTIESICKAYLCHVWPFDYIWVRKLDKMLILNRVVSLMMPHGS